MDARFAAVLRLCAALALFAPAAANARDPLRLAPTSDWRLHRDEDKCRLVRTFGEGEQQVVLMLHQSEPRSAFNVSLIGRPVASPFGTRIGIAFSPGGSEKSRGYIASTRKAALPFVFLHGVSLATAGQPSPADITAVTFSEALPGPVTLETGSLGEQTARMRVCAEELSQTLGVGRLG